MHFDTRFIILTGINLSSAERKQEVINIWFMMDCIYGDVYASHSIFTLADIEVKPKEDN